MKDSTDYSADIGPVSLRALEAAHILSYGQGGDVVLAELDTTIHLIGGASEVPTPYLS